MKSIIAIFLTSCLAAFAQFGGPGLPFFARASSSSGPCSLVLPTLPGLISYVDINGTVIDTNSTTPPLNSGIVGTWKDLGPHNYSLLNTSTIPNPIYFTTGGPTNGACITFTNAPSSYSVPGYLQSALGNFAWPQPLTIFMVINDASCCNADNQGVLFDSLSASNSMQMITFHPAIGITEMNLVAPTSVPLWDGTAFDDSAAFGWAYDAWQIVTVQFNSASTQVYINGTGPKHTSHYGPSYNPGSNSLLGFTLANSPKTALFHPTPFTLPSRASFAAILICQGSDYTSGPLRLQVEEALGCEFGITVP